MKERILRRIYTLLQEEKLRLGEHPMLVKAANLNRDMPVRNRFDWAPAFIHLAMTFRDLNTMMLPYTNPENDLEKEINRHCAEDGDHWHMFLHDLEQLGFDEKQKVSDTVRLIWGENNQPVRKYIYSVLERFNRCGACPLMRYGYMEANETTVELFFQGECGKRRTFL